MKFSRSFGVRAVLVMASLALGHELVYLLAHGFGAGYDTAMSEGGHDRYWTSFVLTAAAVAVTLTAIAARQIVRLQRLARAVPAGQLSSPRNRVHTLVRSSLRAGMQITAITVLLFLVQENVERLSAGQGLPLLGVIAGDHAIAVPVLSLVGLVVAIVASLVVWRRIVLLERLARLNRRWPRRQPGLARAASTEMAPGSADLRGQHGVRAPPGGFVAA